MVSTLKHTPPGWSSGLEEQAAAALAAQPFSQLVGATLAEFSPGTATLELEIRQDHRQQYGVVHGGVLAYLVDNAISFAAGTRIGPSLVSTGFSISLLANLREGTLRATATVLHAASARAVCGVEVVGIDPDGRRRLCAVAQGTAVGTLDRAAGPSPDAAVP